MVLPEKINKIIEKVAETKPVTIFLYGSRARGDNNFDSDYEIGVVYKRDLRVRRSELAKLHNIQNVQIYSFVYENLLDFTIDTPFPPKMYIRELKNSAITLWGEDILANLKNPEIHLTDLLECVSFNTSYALCAYLSDKQGDKVTSKSLFAKSVLFGSRAYVMAKTGKFAKTYEDIATETKELLSDKDFIDLIDHALDVRKGKKLEKAFLFINIKYLNTLVRTSIVEKIDKEGNRVVYQG